MTEYLIKALFSVKSVTEMRTHLKVRRKRRRHEKEKRVGIRMREDSVKSRGGLWKTASL